jgi:hypothetical protein
MRRDPGSAFRTSATCRSAAAADRWVGAKGMGLPPAGMGLPPAVAGATPLRAMAVAAITSRVASLRTRRIGTWEPTKASPPVGACDGAGLCWGQAWRDPLAGSHRRAGAPPPARCPTAAASWQRPRRRTRKRTGNSTGNLHPWAEVAAWSGRTMHRLAQFHAISRPAAAPAGPAPWNDEDPPAGNLPAELLRILCGALAEHTGTTESCWFCLWNGYGWLYGSPWAGIMGRREPIAVPPAFPAEVLDGPRVRLPAGTTCCSPVRWRHHPNSAGPTPTAPSSPSPPTCSGRRTMPGAWPPRSTCSAPWSPGRKPSPRPWWATRSLRHGGSNRQTPSPLTATRSTPR